MQLLLNEIKFRKKINETLKQKRFSNIATLAATSRFNIAKQMTLEQYDSHPAILELQAGPTAMSSSFLDVGNLYSFFGFFQGDTPTTDLRNYLENNIKPIKKSPRFIEKKLGVVYEFGVKVPNLNEIYKAFPMPEQWSNVSWIKALDSGIGTFSYYIFRIIGFIGRSRSGTGLQNKNKIKNRSGDKVLGVNFMPGLLNFFRSYFKSSK